MHGLLYASEWPVSEKISIHLPTVGEIYDAEDEYYDMVYKLTAMPIDLMVSLDKIGIDFSTVDEFHLFLSMLNGLKGCDTSLIFGNLDLTKFDFGYDEDSNEPALINQEDDIVIDRRAYYKITGVLRKLHHLEKDRRKPANEEAKKYMLERAKKKHKRNKSKAFESQLEPLIVAMVNTKEFKYDYQSVRNISIYQFNESVYQIIKRVDYDNRMLGIYTGSISAKEFKPDDLNWLVHKEFILRSIMLLVYIL